LFPRIAAAAVGAFAFAYVVLTVSSPGYAAAAEAGASGGRITGLMLLFGALIVAYALAMRGVGFALSTFLFLWVSMYALHRERAWLSALIAAAAALAISGIFGALLNVDLPTLTRASSRRVGTTQSSR